MHVLTRCQVDADRFAQAMRAYNAILLDAEYRPYGFFDNLLASLTFQLSPYVLGTHYKRVWARLFTF